MLHPDARSAEGRRLDRRGLRRAARRLGRVQRTALGPRWLSCPTTSRSPAASCRVAERDVAWQLVATSRAGRQSSPSGSRRVVRGRRPLHGDRPERARSSTSTRTPTTTRWRSTSRSSTNSAAPTRCGCASSTCPVAALVTVAHGKLSGHARRGLGRQARRHPVGPSWAVGRLGRPLGGSSDLRISLSSTLTRR